MSDALYIAATGMQAQQQQLDTIANNLANVNTPGFKKSRVVFEDLMYRNLSGIADPQSSQLNKSGIGTAVADISKVFSVGEMKKTDRSMDLAIRGDGFFEIMMPDGSYGYTRTGSFRIDSEGFLVTSDGFQVNPSIQIPPDSDELSFDSTGKVNARLPDEESVVELGQLDVATFVNPSGLKALGNNLYLPTNDSGNALYNRPGEDNAGVIAQGFLEASNVQLIEELTTMMLAQRAYEINSKVIQAADEMMSLTNNLRR